MDAIRKAEKALVRLIEAAEDFSKTLYAPRCRSPPVCHADGRGETKGPEKRGPTLLHSPSSFGNWQSAIHLPPFGCAQGFGGQVGNQACCQIQPAEKSALKPLRSAPKRTQAAPNRT